jgi:hypothetical protein
VRILSTLALAIACFSVSASESRPVIIGSEPGLDACLGVDQVGGAKSGLISVRAGPGSGFPEIDRLENGQYVYSCDGTSGWSGIVYLRGKEMTPDCGVTSPVPTPVPYKGRCKSGWVRTKWLTVIAG